ncbi:MAG: N-acetyltransferase family protein [Anaerolineae bacterium]
MISIRPAHADDITAIVSIHIQSWNAQFRSFLNAEQIQLKNLDSEHQQELWQARFNQEEGRTRRTFIAIQAGDKLGYITGAHHESSCDAQLQQIYVRPPAHHQGIGEQLVAALAQQLHADGKHCLFVWVMTINPAITFYRDRLGGSFVEERIIPHGDGILRETAYRWTPITRLFS